MQLALEAGRLDLGALSRQITERDFQAWMRYSERRGLPSHRVELYLAQIAQFVMRAAGAENVTLDDFIFRQRDEALEAEETYDDLEEAMLALDFKPHKTVRKS